ncbi:hypothetical protein [Herbiconiux liukaitaii]|uniref:hypothetical protein n=1 Tax=Herbiconiux liukaitaii TaxID=3342799 RepID=UPI0035B94B8F
MSGDGSPRYDSRFDRAFQPGFVEAEPAATGLEGLGLGQENRVPDVAAPARRRRLVDRFVVILWLVGAAVLGLGVAGMLSLVLGFDRQSSEITPDYLILVIMTQVSPWLIAIGLSTLIGTLFLIASRWERRP